MAKNAKLLPDPINVVFLGDSSTGKTTLIQTLLAEIFAENVPVKSEIVTISSEWENAPISVDMIDTSNRIDSIDEIKSQMSCANVICLTFCDSKSFANLHDWLEIIEDVSNAQGRDFLIPVVLVRTKCDLMDNFDEDDSFTEITDIFPNIVATEMISSLNFENLPKLFYSLQMAAIEPNFAIFDLSSNSFTKKLLLILESIFKILDHDKDGHLIAEDVIRFYDFAFDETVTLSVTKKIITRLKNTNELSTNGMLLTEFGFKQLILKFVQSDAINLVWKMLYRFNYSFELKIGLSVETDKFIQSKKENCELYLSKIALEFISTTIFERLANYDSIKLKSMDNLFPNLQLEFEQEYLTRNELQLLFIYLFAINKHECMKLLFYFGFLYHHESISLAYGYSDQHKAYETLALVSKISLIHDKSKHSVILESLENTTNEKFEIIRVNQTEIFFVDRNNSLATILIDHSRAIEDDTKFIFEVDCSSPKSIENAMHEYIADYSGKESKCSFLIYKSEDELYQEDFAKTLLNFCITNKLNYFLLDQNEKMSNIIGFLQNSNISYNFSDKNLDLKSRSTFNYFTSFLSSRSLNFDTYMYPLVVFIGLAVFILKKTKK